MHRIYQTFINRLTESTDADQRAAAAIVTLWP
jgi:hypothetical protein